jgi:hypothetical protein
MEEIKKKVKGKKSYKLASYDSNHTNPFMDQALEHIQGNITKKYRSATNTGEKAILKAYDDDDNLLGHTSFVRQIEVDEEQFAKIYLSNFSAFFNLSKQAIKVFGYIMTKMIPGQDLIIFLKNECLEHTGYKSHNSLWLGLGDLVEHEILARGPADSLYYINPMVVFNGNRVSFTKSYVKKKKKLGNPNQKSLDFPNA